MSDAIKSTKPHNVRSSIELMQRVIDEERGFSLLCWVYEQGSWKKQPEVESPRESEAASCGMVACYGGWLGISDEFRAAGGFSNHSWAPSIKNDEGLLLDNALAIAFWLGIPYTAAQDIIGVGRSNHMKERWGEGEEPEEFSNFYGAFLVDVKPKHVMQALEKLL